MIKEELLDQLEDVNTQLFDILSSLDERQLNTAPAKNSWSAAQVGEHLFQSDAWMLRTLHGPTKKTERPADAGVPELKKQFLDFTVKLQSPKEIIPPDITYNKATVLDHLKETRSKMNEAVVTLDLSATCFDPVFQEVTRLEVFHFVIYHTRRHIHQLQKIISAVTT
jgi:hypothetical protein